MSWKNILSYVIDFIENELSYFVKNNPKKEVYKINRNIKELKYDFFVKAYYYSKTDKVTIDVYEHSLCRNESIEYYKNLRDEKITFNRVKCVMVKDTSRIGSISFLQDLDNNYVFNLKKLELKRANIDNEIKKCKEDYFNKKLKNDEVYFDVPEGKKYVEKIVTTDNYINHNRDVAVHETKHKPSMRLRVIENTLEKIYSKDKIELLKDKRQYVSKSKIEYMNRYILL